MVVGIRPKPKYNHFLPVTGDIYDTFLSLVDVLSEEEAFRRDKPRGIDLSGLSESQKNRIKFRLLTGERPRETTVEHVPDSWDGKLVNVAYGKKDNFSRWYFTVVDSSGGESTSMVKPTPQTGGYGRLDLGLFIELNNIHPFAIEQSSIELPCPVRYSFDDYDSPIIDYKRMYDYFFDCVEWSGNDDLFILHRPWEENNPRLSGDIDHDLFSFRQGKYEWVSLNPKYRGLFDPFDF